MKRHSFSMWRVQLHTLPAGKCFWARIWHTRLNWQFLWKQLFHVTSERERRPTSRPQGSHPASLSRAAPRSSRGSQCCCRSQHHLQSRSTGWALPKARCLQAGASPEAREQGRAEAAASKKRQRWESVWKPPCPAHRPPPSFGVTSFWWTFQK